MYKQIIRPTLFAFDPEKIHNRMVNALGIYAKSCLLRPFVKAIYGSKPASVNVAGLHLKGHIGLSAGFDKEAKAFRAMPDFGFSFVEIGTATPSPLKGNPSPRLFRMEKCDSLIGRTGFNNPGLDVIKQRLRQKEEGTVVGVNINKNPKTAGTENIVADFMSLVERLYGKADYFTINWGSISPDEMDAVLGAIAEFEKDKTPKRPVFVKLPADVPEAGIDLMLDIATKHGTAGAVATGPTQQRDGLAKAYTQSELEAIGAGAVSGKAMMNKSERVVKYLRSHAPKSFAIIGSGGIMSPADAKRITEAGADLIEIYSAFVFEGPSIASKMEAAIQGKR